MLLHDIEEPTTTRSVGVQTDDVAPPDAKRARTNEWDANASTYTVPDVGLFRATMGSINHLIVDDAALVSYLSNRKTSTSEQWNVAIHGAKLRHCYDLRWSDLDVVQKTAIRKLIFHAAFHATHRGAPFWGTISSQILLAQLYLDEWSPGIGESALWDMVSAAVLHFDESDPGILPISALDYTSNYSHRKTYFATVPRAVLNY